MEIRFVKVAQYDPRVSGGRTRYEAYGRSSLMVSDPSVVVPISYKGQFRHKEFERVYSSPLLRARQSAEYLGRMVKIMDELREVRFDLARLVSRDDFDKYGSALVRKRFVEAFVKDRLVEKREEILTRTGKLRRKLAGLDLEKIVLVSHSFVMKILEAEFGGYDLSDNPGLLRGFIKTGQKTYEFGGGFEIDVRI